MRGKITEKQVNEERSEGNFLVFLALQVYYVSEGVKARMELVSAETNVRTLAIWVLAKKSLGLEGGFLLMY